MSVWEYILGAVLIVISVVLVIIVLLQQSKQQGLSGAIAGGADTFFGKNKGRTMEAKLEKITKISLKNGKDLWIVDDDQKPNYLILNIDENI